jgi:NAD(P)-dependent dehydrogenase (short-subunit alcohol dehydrogenase family)
MAVGYTRAAVGRNLSQSVVVITGASSGIGRAAAYAFARDGWRRHGRRDLARALVDALKGMARGVRRG